MSYTDNEFKQVSLIQAMNGGQRNLLPQKLQVCESRKSCLFVGAKYLFFTMISKTFFFKSDHVIFSIFSFVSHHLYSLLIHMMEITGLSFFYVGELSQLTKYFFMAH